MKKIKCKNIIFLIMFFLLSLFSFGETTEKQKVLNSVNQLIPYYINGAKSDSGDWMKTTDLSINFDEDWNPYYSFGTIQPFGKINEQGDLLFWQGEYNYRENNKSFSNIGFGLRNLSKNKNKIIGLNIFSDNQEEYNLSRIGLGFEFFRNMTEFKFNYYTPTSYEKIIATGSNNEGYTATYIRAVEGLDYEAAIQSKKHPWAKFSASGYFYNKLYNSNENGFKVRTVLQISPQISTAFYYETSNSVDNNFGGSITYKLSHGFIPSLLKNKWFDNKDLTNKMLQKVDRNSIIKTETYTKLTPYQGNIRVTVINSLNSNLPISGVKLQAYKNGVATGDPVVTDSNGQGIISGLDIGTYTVKASYFTSEGTSANISVTRDTTTDGNISLAVVSGKITVSVYDSNANIVEGAKVTATMTTSKLSNKKNKATSTNYNLVSYTDSTGQVTFDNLPSGTYSFQVDNNNSSISQNSSDVTIPESGGEQNVNVVLPDENTNNSNKGTIAILVNDNTTKAKIPNATVTLKQGTTIIDTKITDNEGLVAFSDVATGEYSAVITKDDYTEKSVLSIVVNKGETTNKEILIESAATKITISALSGLTAPVRGATPVTTITETSEYTGTVTWSPAVSGTFAGNTAYTATVTLTPKTGYTLTGVTSNFFSVVGATSASNSANSGTVTVSFSTTDKNPITLPNLGLTAPVTGATAGTTIATTAEYTGSVSWSPTLVGGKFAGNTVYTATIAVSPTADYTLDGVSADFFKVTGASATNSANSGTVTVVFPQTGANPISISALSGLTAPVRGATPVTTITETSEYTGSVSWSGSPSTFAGNTVYTATVTITPKTGYTLTGVTADFFTAVGATSDTNDVNSGTVTVVFPQTGANPISISALSGLTAPVRGATPVSTITETAEYTGTVTWSGSPSTFAGNTVYTATVTITPKAGYTLTGVTADFFTATGATSDTNDTNSGTVTVTFPETAKNPITLPNLGLTAPVAGATGETAISTTVQYTGNVSWSPALVGGKFAGNTVYTATITVSPTTDYTLTGVSADFFKVTGASATNSANSGTVTVTFPTTDYITITNGTISSLTAPVTGGVPDTTITATDEYTATVSWSPNPTNFAASTVYTATINITPKSGYTLSGITENFFTISGAPLGTTVTNTANSGTITVVFPQTGANPISISTLSGLTAPVRGATPVTTITETSEYTGSVSWSGSPSTFAGNTVYTATVTITPKSGYTLSGITENFFTATGATSDTNDANSGTITVVFPQTGANPISISALSGLTAPVRGVTPVTTITETSEYTGTVSWSGSPSTFAGNTVYTATVTITPKTGYTLTGVTADFFTAVGATSDTNDTNSGTVTVVFPQTGANPISISALSGLTAPVRGATPVTTITATDEYTGTVSWSGSPSTFAGNTVYTATVTITPKAGYTLTGVTADFFTATGATSDTNDANSGTVTVVFPQTGANPISISALSGLTTPVRGATPVSTITATDEYTGTVSWSGSPSTFAGNTVYTATVTITPKAGYTLSGITADFFTATGATTDTNDANSGTVTVTFPATAKNPITLPNLGLIAPVTGATAEATITPTAEYTGNVSWSPALVGGKFAGNQTYTATIAVTPTTDYTLDGVSANFFKVTGVSATNSANSGTVTVTFPATAKNPITLPNLGLIAPVAGATRETAISPIAEYTGSVSWAPALVNNKFAGNTVYTATITVTPTTDYTLDGVTENFFKVTGASATNSTNSGTVIVTFPATDYITITQGTINSLIAPVTGEVPDNTITATDEYTATVSWNPNPATFAGNTEYTATITITPESGYTYSGLASSFFIVGGVTGTFNNSTGVITVTFPATINIPSKILDIMGGEYTLTNTMMNGKPYYECLNYINGGEDWRLYYTGSRWEIICLQSTDLSRTNKLIFHTDNTNSTLPPTNGWYDDDYWGVSFSDTFLIYINNKSIINL